MIKKLFTKINIRKYFCTLSNSYQSPLSPNRSLRSPKTYSQPNIMAQLIDSNYKSASVRDRQFSAVILKTATKERLFYMYSQLIQKPNFNTTHLILIFARLIDVELFLKKSGGSNRTKLTEKSVFYRILDQIEKNIDCTLQESLVFLLRKLTHFQFFKIDFSPILTAICAHLLTDDTLTYMDPVCVYKCYFYVVRLCNDHQYKLVPGLISLSWQLVKETQKHIVKRVLPVPYYFNLAKYHYFLPLKSPKRIEIVNKELLLRKKQATNRHLYYWFLFNSNLPENNQTIPIILTELIKKQFQMHLNFKKLCTLCLKLCELNLATVSHLKEAIIDKAIRKLNEDVIQSVNLETPLPHLSWYIELLLVSKAQFKDILQPLKLIMRNQLINNRTDLKVLLYLLEQKAELSISDIQIVINRGKTHDTDLRLLIRVYSLINQNHIKVETNKLKKRAIKLFVSKFFMYVKIELKMKDFIIDVFKSDPVFFTYYLFYLNKILIQMKIVNMHFAETNLDSANEEEPVDDQSADFEERSIVINNRTILYHLFFIDQHFQEFDSTDKEFLLDEVLENMEKKILVSYLNEDRIKEFAEKHQSATNMKIINWMNKVQVQLLETFDEERSDTL